ncbi:hypothetical protein HS088_TW18G00490 [Tripterygium wilfordii]|uniref:Uncharacterized protein n=1 Tax=Tripterygium wilfordii TaxID=458696 RepID=A0A7J7CCZ1_TRIWF|nr:hypothetical protein HS088_TW18G00490 [Tripterygium wilfordii]
MPRTVETLLCTQSWLKNVISIEADDMILDDDDAAEELERVAEEELDCGSGATNAIIDSSSASVRNVGKG